MFSKKYTGYIAGIFVTLLIGIVFLENFSPVYYSYVSDLLKYYTKTSDVPYMGSIAITVTDPLTQKPIPHLLVDYFYDIELPPVLGSTMSSPHKNTSTKYFTNQNGTVTIPQTAVVSHFYEAHIVVNPRYDGSHNTNFGQFDFNLPTSSYYETDFPDSSVLHVTSSSQSIAISLVPARSDFTECGAITIKNVRQCCILRAKKGPFQNCESLRYWFDENENFLENNS